MVTFVHAWVQRFRKWLPEKNTGAADFLRPIAMNELDRKAFAGAGFDRVTDDRPINEHILLHPVSAALTEAQGIESPENPRSAAGKATNT